MSDEPYRVGKGRPPREHQFKKGQPSPNPRGRKKSGPLDVLAVLDEDVEIEIDGQKKRLSSYEMAVINLCNKAVKGNVRAAKRALDLFEEAGLLRMPEDPSGLPSYHRVSDAWDYAEWASAFKHLGPPPWPGPKNGLYNEDWREEVLREQRHP